MERGASYHEFFQLYPGKTYGNAAGNAGESSWEAGAVTILPLLVRMNKHNKLTKIRGVAGVVKLGQS